MELLKLAITRTNQDICSLYSRAHSIFSIAGFKLTLIKEMCYFVQNNGKGRENMHIFTTTYF